MSSLHGMLVKPKELNAKTNVWWAPKLGRRWKSHECGGNKGMGYLLLVMCGWLLFAAHALSEPSAAEVQPSLLSPYRYSSRIVTGSNLGHIGEFPFVMSCQRCTDIPSSMGY